MFGFSESGTSMPENSAASLVRRRSGRKVKRQWPRELLTQDRKPGGWLALFYLSLPDGLALFEERGNPFLEIRRAPHTGTLEDRSFEILIDAGRGSGHQKMFCACNAARAGRKDGFGKFMRPADQFLGRHDFVHQAQLPGFLRFDEPAGKEQVAGTLFPNLPRQENGNNGG